MKAIFINSKAGKVTKVDLDLSGDEGYKRISETIGCEMFGGISLHVRPDGSRETLYFDDVGAIMRLPFGVLHDRLGTLFGNFLIIGTSASGESVDTKLEPYQVPNYGIGYKFDMKKSSEGAESYLLKPLDLGEPELDEDEQ